MAVEQSKFGRISYILDLFIDCFSFNIEYACAIKTFVHSFIVNDEFIVNSDQFIVTLQCQYWCYSTWENRYEMTFATNPLFYKTFQWGEQFGKTPEL